MLISLLIVPLIGSLLLLLIPENNPKKEEKMKVIALSTSLINLFISILLWIQFDSSISEYQFILEFNELSFCHFNIGVDGISLYYVLLTTFITPIALLSNYKNIYKNVKYFLISFLILETLQIALFVVLDLFLFYIFFESVLPILFIIIIVYGSGVNRIRSALLFFLYTLAGITFEVPALNLAICWKHFLYIILESQSAGNLLYYSVIEILREYTPEIVCCNSFLISQKTENLNHLTNNFKFNSYLTGLIEGDGCIHVPKSERSIKGKLNYPSIHIAFPLKDLPLALIIQKNLGFGSIVRQKGANAYYLIINDNKGIITMVNLLNGNMRTSKIYSLYNLINFLNLKNNELNLVRLPFCTSPLDSDAWLSGFIEAEGHFSVRATTTGKYPKVECKFEIVQSQKNSLGQGQYSVLSELSEFLKTPIKTFKQNTPHPQYRLRTSNLESNLLLINYLNNYPLFGSKFLDFTSWSEILDLFRSGFKYSNADNISKVIKLKSEMNNNRTLFNWDHLNKFYNLDY